MQRLFIALFVCFVSVSSSSIAQMEVRLPANRVLPLLSSSPKPWQRTKSCFLNVSDYLGDFMLGDSRIQRAMELAPESLLSSPNMFNVRAFERALSEMIQLSPSRAGLAAFMDSQIDSPNPNLLTDRLAWQTGLKRNVEAEGVNAHLLRDHTNGVKELWGNWETLGFRAKIVYGTFGGSKDGVRVDYPNKVVKVRAGLYGERPDFAFLRAVMHLGFGNLLFALQSSSPESLGGWISSHFSHIFAERVRNHSRHAEVVSMESNTVTETRPLWVADRFFLDVPVETPLITNEFALKVISYLVERYAWEIALRRYAVLMGKSVDVYNHRYEELAYGGLDSLLREQYGFSDQVWEELMNDSGEGPLSFESLFSGNDSLLRQLQVYQLKLANGE